MKSFLTTTFIVLLGAVHTGAECVRPSSYVVEYRCGSFQQGALHNNICSENKCAESCTEENPSESICQGEKNDCLHRENTLTAQLTQCQNDAAAASAEASSALEAATSAASAAATSCSAAAASASADAASALAAALAGNQKCAVPGWGVGYYTTIAGLPKEGCKQRCLSEARCLSYSDNMVGPTGNCYLYEKATKDVVVNPYPLWGMYDRSCA